MPDHGPCRPPGTNQEGPRMGDLIFVTLSLAGFAACLAYIVACFHL
jgi:hypothetical protein